MVIMLNDLITKTLSFSFLFFSFLFFFLQKRKELILSEWECRPYLKSFFFIFIFIFIKIRHGTL